jgi:pimeloyl-ACP methyl ester carboxylesterase
MEPKVVLIPGANPEAAKSVFESIEKNLKEAGYEIIQLKNADLEELVAKAGEIRPKILIGKSLGGKIATDYQLEYKDSKSLILLAPAIREDQRYKEIDIPVLIVHGTEDNVIPIENSKKIKKYFKNCKLVEISQTDHSFTGKESETANTIVNWLNSL